MPRGQPDYGAYAATTVLAGLADMAELAVRLGSINIFDRRGRVAHLDDFEATVLKWNVAVVAGGTAVLDNTDPKSGSQDVKVSLANLLGSFADIDKGFIPLLSNRLGSEISFARPDKNTYFDIVLTMYTGTQLHTAQVRIDFNAGTLAYVNNLGAYVTFAAGLDIQTANFVHHQVKLVADFDTLRYVKFIYGPTEYDLSAYSVLSAGNLTAPHIFATFLLNQRVQAVASIYLDDFILTQDEP